ncbi:MAG: hypothetical protein I3273_01850 [Candidatus Moeniiplasma glomeromycotorum]|nr:hypothetical protein [Candidatus Moeniiplasma glomeromycotorum]MCE8167137.1 hypothetical protein [Candidatus Moeniiplasma glomeromycotorum]MCE8168851.1 hypothetical protein [Candidatus Moeniiplasma glomeromycotorum]
MNSQKIPHNYIENKIRAFKNGVDYTFAGEEYFTPDGNIKGYTTRSYKILSPQLQKVVRDYLTQQFAIFMQFEFEGRAFSSERIRPDNAGKDWAEKYYAHTEDEKDNSLHYGYYGREAEAGYSLSLTCLDKPWMPAEKFSQAYQKAKKAWESKGSPLQNVPPKGTRCWSCYEVISDADIAAGRYRVENERLGTIKSGRLTFFKTFEHIKGVCKPVAYDCALRNNYCYHSELIKKWLSYPYNKKNEGKGHELSCQDCLTRLWHEVNTNLIYLETWAPEQETKIGSHEQVLDEIKARLDRITATGQFHNCGIKKCCVEHDRPELSESERQDLITTGNFEEFSKPKKTAFTRQDLLNWMKKCRITKISRHPQNSEQLLIEYDNGQTDNWSIANDFPAEWGKYLKQEVSQNSIYLNQPTHRDSQNRWPAGKVTVGILLVGLVSAVGILVYWRRKKV